MMTVTEALATILRETPTLAARSTTLDATTLGCVLAEDVASDLDMPPYDKAMMDGYAIRAADLSGGRAELAVVEEVSAGRVPTKTVGKGQATRIMTGAPIPPGADAVVIIERSTLHGERVVLQDTPPKQGQHILYRGREMRKDEVVLRSGAILRPQELGLLAAVGRTSALLYPPATVAVLPTGDEIVDPAKQPGPGQIRNSNGPMLVGQTVRAGAKAQLLPTAPDERESLRALIRRGLESDVLILSGGVSAGKLDLVPDVLRDEGVTPHCHKVAMKPGKPLFFGTRGRTLVFGLPGNPVSSFVGFELFVRPALRKLAGYSEPGPYWFNLPLAEEFAYSTDRPTYHPAVVVQGEQSLSVKVVPWFGSPDLRGLTRAEAMVLLPIGKHVHRPGTMLPVVRLEQ